MVQGFDTRLSRTMTELEETRKVVNGFSRQREANSLERTADIERIGK